MFIRRKRVMEHDDLRQGASWEREAYYKHGGKGFFHNARKKPWRNRTGVTKV